MKFEEYQDRIDDYILDRMSDEERSTFEKEMAADAELQEQVAFMQNMKKALKSRNEKLAAMKEWENDYVWEDERMAAIDIPAKPLVPIKRFVYWISGVAAVFVAGLLIIQNVFLTPSDIDPRGMFREGASYAYIDTLILHEQYQEALTRIEEENEVNRNDSIEFVQDSLMSEEALEYNMLLIKERQDDLKWQTVLVLLGMDRKDEALILLNELRKEKGAYQKDSRALYKLVKRGK